MTPTQKDELGAGQRPLIVWGEEVSESVMLRAVEKASGKYPKHYKTRTGIWTGLPECKWRRAQLGEELAKISLIRNELNWLALGGYLREPVAAGTWFLNHRDLCPEQIEYHQKMYRGKFPKFPCILVGPTDPTPEQLVVLDGNHRVAAALMGGVNQLHLPLIIGTSDWIRDWKFYRDGKKIRKTLNRLGWQR